MFVNGLFTFVVEGERKKELGRDAASHVQHGVGVGVLERGDERSGPMTRVLALLYPAEVMHIFRHVRLITHALLHLQMWVTRGMPFDLVGIVNLTSIQVPAWLTPFVARRFRETQTASPPAEQNANAV